MLRQAYRRCPVFLLIALLLGQLRRGVGTQPHPNDPVGGALDRLLPAKAAFAATTPLPDGPPPGYIIPTPTAVPSLPLLPTTTSSPRLSTRTATPC